MSLVELVIAGALTMVVLAISATLVYVFGVSSANLTANLHSVSTVQTDLAQAVDHLGAARPVLHCNADPKGTWATPYPSCKAWSTPGPALAAAGSQSVCWYESPVHKTGTTPGGAAPDLQCMEADQTSGNLYLDTFHPQAGTTATSCDPSACWGTTATALTGGSETQAQVAATCAGSPATCSAVLIGHMSSAQPSTPVFTYSETNGTPVTAPVPTASLVDVVSVGVNLSFAFTGHEATSGTTKAYQLHYLAILHGSAYEKAHAWNAVAA